MFKSGRQKKTDQCIIIKYLNAQNVMPMRIWRDLCRVHGPLTLSQTAVRNWCRRFTVDPNASCLDQPRSGGPRFAHKQTNIERICRLVGVNNRRSIHELAAAVKVSTGTAHKILHEDLKMKKLSARFVPKILSDAQKQC